MKKLRKLFAILLVALMVFSMAACGKKKDQGSVETTTPVETESTTDNSNKATELTLNVHYLREDGVYDGWNVWLWPDGGEDGKAYTFGTDKDEHGVKTTAVFPAGTTTIGFIVRLNEWESKDIDSDQFITLNGVIAGTVEVYITSGVEGYKLELGEDCVTGLSVLSAELDGDFQTLKITLTEEYKDNEIKVTDAEGKELAIDSVEKDSGDAKKIIVKLKEKADQFGKYKVMLGNVGYDVTVPDYYSTSEFEDAYTYDGDDLGASWSKDSTTFKVWAPTAKAVKVNTYKSGVKGTDDLIKSYDMTLDKNGVWTVKAEGDLNGVFYLYEADFGSSKTEACDPYAKAVGVNGDRAMVIDLSSTDPDGWDKDTNPNKKLNATDASVYELHIRDLSADSSSGIKNIGKYLGLTETGTTNGSGQATGLDHIKELGVTHVQIGPMYDYATVDETKLDTKQYNWGYDPKNYNVPEGSYSSDPYNGAARVSEVKQMVKALHDNGLSVVMDVVYNHTYNTSYCFNELVPDYFYRPGANGSGCGNDVASERAMVSKFIVDSVVYWAKEYHIDGFRFDLVGLIDMDTIKAIRTELDKIDPSIILYGEGWSMTTKITKSGVTLATQMYVNKLDRFAMFSDTIRDAIKGSVFNADEKGYVNGNISNTDVIKKAIQGKTGWSEKGSQNIVYASCHDNRTLWDEINLSNPNDSMEDKVKQNLLSAAIVYTSQGTPFILAGEEILRSKPNGDGTFSSDSYNAVDEVHSIKWSTLSDATYQKVFNYYKGMIAFRKAHASLRIMDTASSYYKFTEDTDKGVIAYELTGVKEEVSDSIFVVYNPLSEATTVTLPEGDWTICVQGDKAGTDSLGTANGKITVDGISCTILVKGATK